MRASDYQALLARVDTYGLGDAEKKVVVDAIRKLAKDEGFACFDRGERLEFACKLLDQGLRRAVIRARLMALYEIGKTQAYEDITAALQLSGKRPENRTKQEENVINEEAITQGVIPQC